jgi:choline dehydrogenase-like flavoprotein
MILNSITPLLAAGTAAAATVVLSVMITLLPPRRLSRRRWQRERARCREIANSAALRPFMKREVMPGNLKGAELKRFVPDAAMSYWHQTCTAKMDQDAMSAVDGTLKLYGIQNLCIADGSIMSA